MPANTKPVEVHDNADFTDLSAANPGTQSFESRGPWPAPANAKDVLGFAPYEIDHIANSDLGTHYVDLAAGIEYIDIGSTGSIDFSVDFDAAELNVQQASGRIRSLPYPD